MHKIYLLLISVLLTSGLFSQTLIAGWDFQTTTNGGTATAVSPNTPTVYNANVGVGTIYLNGTNGSSSWSQTTELNAFAGTALNGGGTTGLSTTTTSPASLAPLGGTSNAANGKFIVFKFSMANLKDLIVSYATQRTTTGFNTQTWEYSIDGTTWLSATTFSTIATSFEVKTLATITGLDNVTTAYLRLTLTGASAASGNNRFDNIQLNASPVTVTPSITLTTANFNGAFGNVSVGASSSTSSFTVSGSNLTNDIVVTPPAGGFEIRTGTNAFSPSAITLPQSSGSVAATTIDARFTPATTGAQSGNIAVSSTGATDKTVAVSGTGVQPTKLAITTINPASPTVNTAFSVTVQAQDASSTATNVLAATDFTLSVNTGTGTLGGTVTGTIAAGANQAIVTGVAYNTAENGVVLTATRTAGDALAAGNSAPFNVAGTATQLAFVNFPASGNVNSNVSAFTVEARRADNSVDGGFTGNITLNIASGTGNITGTLTKAAVAGVATFNDIKFDAIGNFTLAATSTRLTAATSGTITISAAPSAINPGELLINQMSPAYSGASDEYVELVNVTSKTLDLSTIALKYLAVGGGTGSAGGNLSGTLAPYSYWLLSPNSTITVGQTNALSRDGSIAAGFAGGGGQIGIVRISDNVKIDAVGYGGSTGAYTEGTSATMPPSPGGIKRVTDGVDTDANSTDFTTVTNANIDLKNSTSRIANAGSVIPAGTYNRLYVTGNSSINGAITLTGRLILNNGYLTTTSTNSLKLATTATVSGGSNTSFVEGPVTGATAAATAKLLPVGKAGMYKPVTITPTTADASEYTAEYFAATPPSAPLDSRVSAIQSNEYWMVDRTSGTAPASVTLNYNSTGATWSNGTSPSTSDVITIVHLRNATNTWTPENGSTIPGSTGTATLTSGAVTTFSPFTFGYGPSSVLPVTITSFTGIKTITGNQLSWTAANETNFSQYIVERSTDGTGNFKVIATLNASNAGKYTLNDAATTGYNYYRLKLVDRDGKSTYSKTILIINQAKGFEVTNVYPTITNGTVLLESYAATPVKATIKLVNQNGQTVYIGSVVLNQATITNVSLNQFAKGNYLLQIATEGYSKTVKLIKQ